MRLHEVCTHTHTHTTLRNHTSHTLYFSTKSGTTTCMCLYSKKRRRTAIADSSSSRMLKAVEAAAPSQQGVGWKPGMQLSGASYGQST